MLIENKWQPFISVAETVWPDQTPFKVEAMTEAGARAGYVIGSFNELDKFDDWNLVSIRIYNVVNEETRLVRNLIADHIPRTNPNMASKYQPKRVREGSLDKHYTTKVVRGIVRAYGLTDAKPEKVDVNLPAWVKAKLPSNKWTQVAEWLSDVNGEDYVLRDDYVERQLNNGLLAVRNYAACGRRVVLPTGHSLAYTTVRKAYLRIKETGTLTEFGRDMKVTVGELRGKSRAMIDHHAIYHAHYQLIRVGCQRIPLSALTELAEREGWNA